MAEQFSLCWDNFHSNLSTSFSELLKTEDLVDVTLAAEGRYLKAHKIVLSVCSPYFQELFHVNPCQHPIVFLKDVSYSALSNLLQFMYQGEVKVSQDELTNFIKVAEALKIKGLTGDGVKDNEDREGENSNDIPEPITNISKETTLTRKSSYGRNSPIRKKMMGPASKRPKPEIVQQPPPPPQPRNDLPEIPPHMIEDVRTIAPEAEQYMNFKMEPEEMNVTYDDGNEDFSYDDTNPDVSNMSDSADYLLEAKMDMKDVKPGTSNADPAGDQNQDEEITFVQGNKGSIYPQLIARNYIYYRYRGSLPNEHYWKCSLYDRGLCKARCTTYNNVVEFYGNHTHQPDLDRIANRVVVSKLKVKVKKCQDGDFFRASKCFATDLPSYMRLPEDRSVAQKINLPYFNQNYLEMAQSISEKQDTSEKAESDKK